MAKLVLYHLDGASREALFALKDGLAAQGLPRERIRLVGPNDTARPDTDGRGAELLDVQCLVQVGGRPEASNGAVGSRTEGYDAPDAVIRVERDESGQALQLAYVHGGGNEAGRPGPYASQLPALAGFLARLLVIAPVRLPERGDGERAEDLAERVLGAIRERAHRQRASVPLLLLRLAAGYSAEVRRELRERAFASERLVARLASRAAEATALEVLADAAQRQPDDPFLAALSARLGGLRAGSLAILARQSGRAPGIAGAEAGETKALERLDAGDLRSARHALATVVREARGADPAPPYGPADDTVLHRLRQARLFLEVLGDPPASWEAARLAVLRQATPESARRYWSRAARWRLGFRVAFAVALATALFLVKPFGLMEWSSNHSAMLFNAVLGPWYPHFVPAGDPAAADGPAGSGRWPITVVLADDTFPYPPRYETHAMILEAMSLRHCRAQPEYDHPPPRAVFVDFYFSGKRQGWDASSLQEVVSDYRHRLDVPVFMAVPEPDAHLRGGGRGQDGGGPRWKAVPEPLVADLVESGAEPVVATRYLDTLRSNAYPLSLGPSDDPRRLATASPALALCRAHCSREVLARDECPCTTEAGPAQLQILWPGIADRAMARRLTGRGSGTDEPAGGKAGSPRGADGLWRRVWTALWKGVAGLRMEQPPFRTILARELLVLGGGCDSAVARSLSDSLVLYGGLFEGGTDTVLPPTHEGLAGIYMHAAALANLLDYGPSYKSSDPTLEQILQISLYGTFVVLYLAVLGRSRAESRVARTVGGVGFLTILTLAILVLVPVGAVALAGLPSPLPRGLLAATGALAGGAVLLVLLFLWEPVRAEFRLIGNAVHVVLWAATSLFLGLASAMAAFHWLDLPPRNWVGLTLLGLLIPFQLSSDAFRSTRPVGRGMLAMLDGLDTLKRGKTRSKGGV